jgi:hypothetical protein
VPDMLELTVLLEIVVEPAFEEEMPLPLVSSSRSLRIDITFPN